MLCDYPIKYEVFSLLLGICFISLLDSNFNIILTIGLVKLLFLLFLCVFIFIAIFFLFILCSKTP